MPTSLASKLVPVEVSTSNLLCSTNSGLSQSGYKNIEVSLVNLSTVCLTGPAGVSAYISILDIHWYFLSSPQGLLFTEFPDFNVALAYAIVDVA
jgi:hypothetical protein